MKRRNTKGFTLGEVLLVVAIISALTAIGIPSLMKEIDKAKLRVDQAHVQEAVSMATSQYAADHESVTVVYYYDANRSEIQKENRNIYGYGKSTKEPYKHNTHVTDSTVPVNDDGTRNLVRVTVTKQSGEFSIESSWVPAAVNGETPPPTSTPVTTPDPNKKTFGDVEITVAGSWPTEEEVKAAPEYTYFCMQWGYVYTYNGKYYVVSDKGLKIDTWQGGYQWKSPMASWQGDYFRQPGLELTEEMFSHMYTTSQLKKLAETPDKFIPRWSIMVSDDGNKFYVCLDTACAYHVDNCDNDTGRFIRLHGAVLKRKQFLQVVQ